MDTRDQQLSQFAESGLGRITINAGKSRSYGAEAALRASVTKELSLNVSYGYTYATFTDYVITEEQKDGTFKVTADYNGKYVPFVPKHTLNIGGEYAITCSPRSIFDRVVFQLIITLPDVSTGLNKTMSANLSMAHSTGERIWKSVTQ